MPTVVSVCPACLQPRPAPHSTICSEAEQSPTPHSSVSQMTFSMRLHQSSISTTILSTSLWPDLLVPISSYPTYPISNNPRPQRYLLTMGAPRKTSQHARDIREVHMCERHNYTPPDRMPTTLIDPQLDLSQSLEADCVRNICEALSHMSDLRVFSWCWNTTGPQQRSKPTILPAHEDAILDIVRQKPALKHLGLSGRSAYQVQSFNIDRNSISYPVRLLSLSRSDMADNARSFGMYPT